MSNGKKKRMTPEERSVLDRGVSHTSRTSKRTETSESSRNFEKGKESKNKSVLNGFLIFLFVAVIAVGSFLGVIFLFGDRDKAPEPPVETTETQVTETPGGVVGSQNINPIADIWKEAPAPLSKEVSANVDVKKNEITTTEDKAISLGDSKLDAQINECKVSANDEFCLITSGKTKSGKHFDAYFFKDVAHSRTLENPANFKKVDVNGSPAAGVIYLAKSGGKSVPSAVVALNDSTGVVFMFDQSASDSDIQTMLNGTTVR